MNMLRIAVATICALIIAAVLVSSATGGTLFLPGLIWPVIILLGLAFERWRYTPSATSAPMRFQPTNERFEDPETGHIFEVMFDPQSGERRYIDTQKAARSATR